jgi:hypothetical protein
MDFGTWLKEWAVPLSAGATFLLALAAFWAIWQNYQFKKRERKERLLNEIIDWAIDAAKCRFEDKSTSMFSFKNFGETGASFWRFLVDIQDNLRRQQTIGFYIIKISPIFSQNINTSVVTLMKVIQDFINIIDEPMRDIENILIGKVKLSDKEIKRTTNFIDKTGNSTKLLDESANKVIEEAAKIKTKGIG